MFYFHHKSKLIILYFKRFQQDQEDTESILSPESLFLYNEHLLLSLL